MMVLSRRSIIFIYNILQLTAIEYNTIHLWEEKGIKAKLYFKCWNYINHLNEILTWAYRVYEYGYHIYFLILLLPISFVAQFTKLLRCEINNLWCISGCSVFESIQSLSQTSWLLYFSNRDILKGCSCHVFLEICVIF